jgi:hypothetical protein
VWISAEWRTLSTKRLSGAADGAPIRGGRIIDEPEIAIAHQIFRFSSAGKRPRKIAFDLNDRGHAGTTRCRLGLVDHQ